jgi:hypothetical protein
MGDFAGERNNLRDPAKSGVMCRARGPTSFPSWRCLPLNQTPSGDPVVIGLDDTIERRWGGRIKAHGIYRDPVRSSHGHFVKASGLRWLSLMLLPVLGPGGVGHSRFLTVMAPLKRYWHQHKSGKRQHKKLTD